MRIRHSLGLFQINVSESYQALTQSRAGMNNSPTSEVLFPTVLNTRGSYSWILTEVGGNVLSWFLHFKAGTGDLIAALVTSQNDKGNAVAETEKSVTVVRSRDVCGRLWLRFIKLVKARDELLFIKSYHPRARKWIKIVLKQISMLQCSAEWTSVCHGGRHNVNRCKKRWTNCERWLVHKQIGDKQG